MITFIQYPGQTQIRTGHLKADPELFNYVNNEVPKYGSTEAFLRNFLPSLKGKDANGIIAIQPYNIPLVQDQNGNVVRDENGIAIVSDEPISPLSGLLFIKEHCRAI